jgi:CheY-like chemotaxis protein
MDNGRMDKKTIMVVDDDAEVREAVTELLEAHGYAVVPARNGKEALTELKALKLRPSLILLDLMMPVMDGQTFCAKQQSDPDLKDIPVVVFTAFSAAMEQMKAVEDKPHLEKPVQVEELLQSVDFWSDDKVKH